MFRVINNLHLSFFMNWHVVLIPYKVFKELVHLILCLNYIRISVINFAIICLQYSEYGTLNNFYNRKPPSNISNLSYGNSHPLHHALKRRALCNASKMCDMVISLMHISKMDNIETVQVAAVFK